jgi:tRNA (guanine-N7-)-methyltransferase
VPERGVCTAYTVAPMHANSRPVSSPQTGIHENLERKLRRHAETIFLKPVAPYNRDAFLRSMEAWQAAGAKPLILDAGCGVGLSTLHLATRFPDHFVIGIDRSMDRTARNTQWPGASPANCIRLRADLIDYWRLMFEAAIRLDRHYLLYPNPWPKQHHLGRRWHGHPVFPVAVALGGYFECRSNWQTYIEECAAALKQLTGVDVAVEAYRVRAAAAADDNDAPLAITPFEQKYAASGHALWRCRTQLALEQPGD